RPRAAQRNPPHRVRAQTGRAGHTRVRAPENDSLRHRACRLQSEEDRRPAPNAMKSLRNFMKTPKRPTVITPNVLRRVPRPLPCEGGDKEERGRVLVGGGSRETPGAVVLAGTAALRAGAGKLQLATGAADAPLVAASVPEARVFALPETKTGKLAKAACVRLEEHIGKAQVVCIGPGMIEDESVVRFVGEALRRCERVPVVLDACASA